MNSILPGVASRTRTIRLEFGMARACWLRFVPSLEFPEILFPLIAFHDDLVHRRLVGHCKATLEIWFLITAPNRFVVSSSRTLFIVAASDSSPLITSVRELLNTISHVYSSSSLKWDTITALSEHLGWDALTNTTVAEYLSSQHGVSDKYISEVVEAATRVNYGQVCCFSYVTLGLR